MKLTSREITELHLLATFEWRGWPRLVRMLHRLYAVHVKFLGFLVWLRGRTEAGRLG